MSRGRRIGSLWIGLALAGLLTFHGVHNWLVLQEDTMPVMYDGAGYYTMALNIIQDVREATVLEEPWILYVIFVNVSNYRPPLFMVTAAAVMAIFGQTPDVAVMSGLLYLALLLWSTFAIGREIDSDRTGLLAAALVSLFPIVYGFERLPYLDLPLTAMVAWAVLMLLRSRGWRSRPYALAWGLACGLGMLAKWTFALYMVAPFGVILWREFREARLKGRVPWGAIINMGLAVGVGVAVAGSWYFHHLGRILQAHSELATSEKYYVGGDLLQALWEYPFYLWEFQLHPALAVAGGLALLALAMRPSHQRLLLLSWVAVPWLIFIQISVKDPRFTMPYLPAIALAMAVAAMGIRHDMVRALGAVALVLFGLGQCVYLTWFNPAASWATWDNPNSLLTGLLFPRKGDWGAQAIVDAVGATSPVGGREEILLIIPNIGPMHGPLAYLRPHGHLHMRADVPGQVDYSHGEFYHPPTTATKADYVVNKDGDLGLPAIKGDPIIGVLNRIFGRIRMRFKEIDRIRDLPDGSMMRIYERRCHAELAAKAMRPDPLAERTARALIDRIIPGATREQPAAVALLHDLGEVGCLLDSLPERWEQPLYVEVDPADLRSGVPLWDIRLSLLDAQVALGREGEGGELWDMVARSGRFVREEAVAGPDGSIVLWRRRPGLGPVMVQAQNFSSGNVRVDNEAWGPGMVVDGQSYPNEASYEFHVAQEGEHLLIVEMAAKTARPVAILVDGREAVARALDRATGGWSASDLMWVEAGVLSLSAGKHAITLRSPMMPHLHALALVRGQVLGERLHDNHGERREH